MQKGLDQDLQNCRGTGAEDRALGMDKKGKQRHQGAPLRLPRLVQRTANAPRAKTQEAVHRALRLDEAPRPVEEAKAAPVKEAKAAEPAPAEEAKAAEPALAEETNAAERMPYSEWLSRMGDRDLQGW